MKKIFATILLFIQVSLFMMPSDVFAQRHYRKQGFIIRPELYGTAMAEFGYQINPILQFSLGGGVDLVEQKAVPEFVAGVRAYTSASKWTAFFDYNFGLLLIDADSYPNHRISVGASYKNLDFGGGIRSVNLDGLGLWVPCLNIGYNIRFSRKR